MTSYGMLQESMAEYNDLVMTAYYDGVNRPPITGSNRPVYQYSGILNPKTSW